MDSEAIQVRATRRALADLGSALGTLTRLQTMVIACLAVHRAQQTMDARASFDQQEAVLYEAARAALAEALYWNADPERRQIRRAALVGGIQKLPQQQQLVLSLRFEHDMNDREIAAVLGITEQDVAVLQALAFEDLLGRTAP